MIRQEYSYTELKQTTLAVKAFIADNYWGKKLTLATCIEKSLGITGDDAWELIEKFEKEFSTDLTELKHAFLDYFNPESNYISSLFVDALLFPLRFIAFVLVFVFSWERAIKIIFYSQTEQLFRKNKELKIKDLVLSALNKRFTTSEECSVVIAGTHYTPD